MLNRRRLLTGALILVALGVGVRVLVPGAASEEVQCTHGMGYYRVGAGWEPCPKSGPDGYYDKVVFFCLDCQEEICEGTSPWYNQVEDGDYACHTGSFAHIGHKSDVTAIWTYDVVHDDFHTVIEEYNGGTLDLYFEFF